MPHPNSAVKTKNYSYNITAVMYSNRNPVPLAHTFYVLDHNGECVDEFDTFEAAKKCYINQSPEHFVGAWQVIAVQMITLQ